MSQNDEEMELSETEEQTDLKLVPVSESIRYRRRAQSAEKRNQQLAEQLSHKEAQVSELAGELEGVRLEQKLISKLYQAGVRDLEAAMLLAKVRISGDDKKDLDACIEQLKKEKGYLFGNQSSQDKALQRSAGAKEKGMSNQTVLEQAAKRAATTGGRRDLQEYLKLRRRLI
jgi:uncharacterized protein YajQ (UPF0234 family)